MNRTDGNARVDIAVKQKTSDGAPVPSARRLLELLDQLNGHFLRRSRQRDRPHVTEQRIDTRESGAEPSLNVVHRVKQAGIALNEPAAEQPDRPRTADARLVVAIHVR